MNRALGASELVLWLQSQRVPINVIYCGSITGPVDIPRLREALDFVQRRHPLLAAKIQVVEGQPRFLSGEVPTIPLRVVPRRGEQDWLQEAEAELTRPFDQALGPLLRAVLLSGGEAHELLLCFDHCIGDGMSAAFLLRDILRELEQPGRAQLLPEPAACEELVPAGTRSPPPGPPAPPPSGPPRPELRSLQGTRPPATPEGRKNRLLQARLSEEDSARLLEVSRRQRTSVHGALSAAYLLALATELDASEDILLANMSPLNLRDHLSPPGGEAFAAYFSRQLTFHPLRARSDFWALARGVREQLRAVTEGAGVFANLLRVQGLLAQKPDPLAIQSFMRAASSSELTVTNLGRLDLGERFGPLTLRAGYLTVSGLAPLIVGVVTTGGRVNLCARFLEALIPSESAERIHREARTRLQAAMSA